MLHFAVLVACNYSKGKWLYNQHKTSFMLWICVLICNSLPLIRSNFTPSWFTAIFLVRNANNTLFYNLFPTSPLPFFPLNYSTRWNHQIKWGDSYFVLYREFSRFFPWAAHLCQPRTDWQRADLVEWVSHWQVQMVVFLGVHWLVCW